MNTQDLMCKMFSWIVIYLGIALGLFIALAAIMLWQEWLSL